jgi:hypothetical protein
LRAGLSTVGEQFTGPRRDHPNPNAPVIDPQSRGVGNAVVFLRGVDPRRARPWDLGSVRVVWDDPVRICQGDAEGRRVGFVRRSDAIDMASNQSGFCAIQALGADFFAFTLPEQGTVRRRVVRQNGLVELTSNSGQFWRRAHLFVDDHPYYAHTDADGRFMLLRAPPGDYDIVCWMPDWREAGHEIDADTRLITRMTFKRPLEVVQRIHIEAGQTATVDFTLSLDQFDRVRPNAP